MSTRHHHDPVSTLLDTRSIGRVFQAAGVLAVFSNENSHSAHVVSKAAGRSGLPHAAFFHDSGGISLYGYREERIKGAAPLALPRKGQYQPSFCFKDFDFGWAE